jgi:thiol-disulfide isomerase/thioredoxin
MKHLTLLAALFATVSLSAQTTLTQAVDFTVTDLDGDDHTLFEYLDAGQYVCIDFFAYWCGPCMSTAPFFTENFHSYGCNTGAVTFLGVEYEGTDTQTHDFEEAYAGQNPPPVASGADGGGGAAHSAYGIAAFPTFILIAPDGSIVEQDIWPMGDASVLDDALASYGLEHMACTVDMSEEEGFAFETYPVPARDVINVKLPSGGANVEVLNLLGQFIFSATTTDTRMRVDVSSWPAGSYMLRATTQGKTVTQHLQVID